MYGTVCTCMELMAPTTLDIYDTFKQYLTELGADDSLNKYRTLITHRNLKNGPLSEDIHGLGPGHVQKCFKCQSFTCSLLYYK